MILCLLAGCRVFTDAKAESPPGYDLDDPITIKLPLELDEVSGVQYYPKDGSVFAIIDESGSLYKIFLNNPKQIQKWLFSSRGDYEDLVLLDSSFYMLKSHGNIVVSHFVNGNKASASEIPFPFEAANEFETIYYDNHTGKLVLICKDCQGDKKSFLTTFIFDPNTSQFDSVTYSMDVERIAQMHGENKIKFKPSAASIHPVTGELFIISSINQLLVVADRTGIAKHVYRLDKGDFKQPEGLCFMPDGTLIVSNEAAGTGVANILVFPYHVKQQRKK